MSENSLSPSIGGTPLIGVLTQIDSFDGKISEISIMSSFMNVIVSNDEFQESDFLLIPAVSIYEEKNDDTLLRSAAAMLCDYWDGKIETRLKKMLDDKNKKCLLVVGTSDSSVYGYAELDISSTSEVLTKDSNCDQSVNIDNKQNVLGINDSQSRKEMSDYNRDENDPTIPLEDEIQPLDSHGDKADSIPTETRAHAENLTDKSISTKNDTMLHISTSQSIPKTVPYGILTSFIINKEYRGRGLGSVILRLIEKECNRRGYCYLYLWTTEAVNFYRKNGFKDCDPVNSNKAIFNKIDESSLSKLEVMIKSKFNKDVSTAENTQGVKDIWLRKRILKSIPIICNLNWSEFETSILACLKKDYRSCKYFYHPIPWLRQVGPSCGLAALDMVHRYYRQQNKLPTSLNQIYIDDLLEYATQRGYSSDGEVFDIDYLIDISDHSYPAATIRGEVIDVSAMDRAVLAQYVTSILTNHLIIMAYDRDDLGSMPCRKLGAKAHYIVIVGWFAYSSIFSDPPCHRVKDSISLNESEVMLDDVYLVGIHSLSSRPVVASLSDWFQSNAQLDCDPRYYPKHFVVQSLPNGPNLANKIAVFSLQ